MYIRSSNIRILLFCVFVPTYIFDGLQAVETVFITWLLVSGNLFVGESSITAK